MSDKFSLDKYKNKRNFKESPEPKAEKAARKNKQPLFVVQKHAASRLHYDFRLEIKGVLKSWAVPKGPSLNPADKRLAVETEDHPLAYANFEGTIPKGHYGAGTVVIWDKGTYQNIKKDKTGKEIKIEKSYQKGQMEFKLQGKKLKGNFALIRFKPKKQWLLIKMKNKNISS
ncbi:MAG: DNA ligase [Candidatus Omnitrophica bacterium]|nr:DNA ligase [Candidatus Omnitrophota bacterium]MCF7894227.1 DNA ligase [Candidatus Omnitrophota bacterium]